MRPTHGAGEANTGEFYVPKYKPLTRVRVIDRTNVWRPAVTLSRITAESLGNQHVWAQWLKSTRRRVRVRQWCPERHSPNLTFAAMMLSVQTEVFKQG